MEKNQNLDLNQNYPNNKTTESDIIDEKLNYIKENPEKFFLNQTSKQSRLFRTKAEVL